MSDQIVDALKSCGVENVQFFEAHLVNPDTGERFENYKAYNIVGLVPCLDALKSVPLHSGPSFGRGDLDFLSLGFKVPTGTASLIFRMEENISAVLVHEKIRRAIEDRQIEGIEFYDSGEWSG